MKKFGIPIVLKIIAFKSIGINSSNYLNAIYFITYTHAVQFQYKIFHFCNIGALKLHADIFKFTKFRYCPKFFDRLVLCRPR